jgi:hypothetical protein
MGEKREEKFRRNRRECIITQIYGMRVYGHVCEKFNHQTTEDFKKLIRDLINRLSKSYGKRGN